jgi:hypothetical protein
MVGAASGLCASTEYLRAGVCAHSVSCPRLLGRSAMPVLHASALPCCPLRALAVAYYVTPTSDSEALATKEGV